MKYLFKNWDGIKKDLSDNYILLFLDYDGTLAPIVSTPEEASISPEVKDLLSELSKNLNCKLAIISGRSLKDIKNIIGLKEVIYSGNHGLEIEGPKIKFEAQVLPRLKLVIRAIAADMKKRFLGIKGVLIEDKGLTLSIHYRKVSKKDMPVFEKIIFEVTNPYVAGDNIKVNSGKKVYEIKPPIKWDKGKVVLWLLARRQFISGEKNVLPVYIGDDVTDEDVFKALKRKGLTVFVGESGDSNADYYLKNTEEVTKFLRLISDLKHN
ncbi:MAG: trehalose-phosphatase [Candidatus Omnitrophica bacterium]|nr:trehalose-phosphatase [Candidatus Omnitrophota bacterium]